MLISVCACAAEGTRLSMHVVFPAWRETSTLRLLVWAFKTVSPDTTLKLEPIQHIEELHSQLGIDPFAKATSSPERKGIPQIADPARRISEDPRTGAPACCSK